jgi:hypothetical protein
MNFLLSGLLENFEFAVWATIFKQLKGNVPIFIITETTLTLNLCLQSYIVFMKL